MRVALAFVGLLLPGIAWWLWLGDRRKDGAQALAGIVAISASVIAVGTLGLYTVRLKVTPMLLGVLLGLCFGLAVAGLIRRGKGAFDITWLFALLGLAVALVWRFWQARELILPNWVDSQHHVLIVRKMIEYGGLPSTLEPYLPGPFYYHFGFHSVAALFSVLSGLDPAASVLVLGQAISACVGLAVYALAKQLGKDWRIGLLAALFVTFATKMPGYYLSWGRYTLLIGVMILPVAMAEVMQVMEKRDNGWKLGQLGQIGQIGQIEWIGQLVGLSLLTAGTLLSHYLTALLLAGYYVLCALVWLVQALRRKDFSWRSFRTHLIPIIGAAMFGLIMAARWYWRVFRYSFGVPEYGVYLPESGLKLDRDQVSYLLYILGPKVAYGLIVLAFAGLIWAFSKKDWRPFALWSLIIAVFTVPLGMQILNFRSDHFGLIMFIPIGILSAACLVWLAQWLESKLPKPRLIWLVLIVIALVITGFGAQANQDAINDSTVLVTLGDIDALKWLETHTPKDARFFVNTTGWGYGLYRGVDGGGWILPTIGRWSLAPTTFYPYGGDAQLNATWTDWAKGASTVTSCGAEFWELVEEAGLNYVYIRDGAGSLHSDVLSGCEGLVKLYDNEGVSVWLIEEKPESQGN